MPLARATAAARTGGVLIGPEGGLASHEWGELDSRDFVTAVTLGSNVLRAETAAMAALAIVGSDFGDDLTRGTGEF